MAGGRTVDIKSRKFVFDKFFKIEELVLSHQLHNGAMSADQTRLVFERGDAVGVLLFNLDLDQLIAVRQFRAPAHGKHRENGWMVETIAGMIAPGETAPAAAVRETKEETGYQITNPIHITTFFSSPGGSSERIFLYFAKVNNVDKIGLGGGRGDEDIEIVHFTADQLFSDVNTGAIEDPKLIIAASWLQLQRLQSQVQQLQSQQRSAAPRGPLPPSTVRYVMKPDATTKDHPDMIVGYKTGDIAKVEGVDVWVNSENEDMMMDRFIGKTVSANIRYLGAAKDRDEKTVREDTIADALGKQLGRRLHVKIGDVIETIPGALATRGVRRILHVATVKGMGAGRGVKADLTDLPRCTDEVLMHVDRENQRFWRRKLFRNQDKSILIPMMGAGDGGLDVAKVAAEIIPQAVKFFKGRPDSALREIYFLAFGSQEKAACEAVLDRLCAQGDLVRRD